MPRADRLAYLGLAVAMAASAALLLWTSRGLTFYNDEIGWVAFAPADYDLSMLLRPHNTHLIAVPRLIYTVSLDLFGPAYLPLRIAAVTGVLLCAGLFFTLARSRIGALAALAPTMVLLFFGTAWNVVVSPVGIPFLYATAAGLGAVVALELGGRRGDIAASLLSVLSLASHSIGVSFLVGVAVSVLIRGDRVRRLWVFAAPLALFAAWWLLFSGSTGPRASLADPSNALGLPVFIVSSLGAVLSAVAGLNLELDPGAVTGFNRPPSFTWTLVPVLALAGLVGLALRLRRGGVSPALCVFAAVLLTFWISIGLSAGPGRAPTTPRYLYPGAVMLGLVVVELVRGARLRRPAVVALVAAVALSVVVNVVHVFEARRFLLAYTDNVRPTLAMVELAGEAGTPTFRPGIDAPGASPRQIGVTAAGYRAGAAKWGSLAAPLSEVRAAPPIVRQRADKLLARSLGLELGPASPAAVSEPCVTTGGRPAAVRLPAGGAVLRSLRGRGGPVALRRFGESFSVVAGDLPPGGRVLLETPRDRAPEPWLALLPPGKIEVCATRVGNVRIERYCELNDELEAARGQPPGRVRPLVAQLLASAPPEIAADLKTVIGSAVGGGRPRVAAAQARVDAFEARRCGG